MFEVIKIADEAPDLTEQLGTKMKFWFRGGQGENVLFKEGRPGTGENWSEKVASELCDLLGIPHAHYDFALWKDKYGIVTTSIVPEGGSLIHGNELISRVYTDYDLKKFYRQRRHTLGVVRAILGQEFVRPPIDCAPFSGVKSAVDFFLGYLMLDALIANQDRHHENWALISLKGQERYLAPTYDHAAGLGRNESDVTRIDRLETNDKRRSIESYVEKAHSGFYLNQSKTRPMLTIDAFSEAAKHSPDAAKGWISRLRDLSLNDVSTIFDRIPRGLITPSAARFAIKMIVLNKKRILDIEGPLL